MPITIGVDQSYKSCAYVIVNRDTQDVINFGVFKSNPEEDIFTRALYIAKCLSRVIKEHNVSAFNIEGLAFGIAGDATRDLAGLQFTIMTILTLDHPTITRQIIPPTTLKKFATGSGKSDKNAMISCLPDHIISQFKERNFKKTTGLTDLADAFWLANYSKSVD